MCVIYALYIKGLHQIPRARAYRCCPKKDTKRTQKGQHFYYPGRLEIKQKWTKTLACVSNSLYISKECPKSAGLGQIHVAPKRTQKGHKKDTKRTTKNYGALDSFNSSRNKLKYCLVCNLCSIHKRIAPNAQGKGKSTCSPKFPGQGQIHFAQKRTRKGHKKDPKNYIALDGFNSGRNELKYCLVCNLCSIHKRIRLTQMPRARANPCCPKKDTKRTQKGRNFYCPGGLEIKQKCIKTLACVSNTLYISKECPKSAGLGQIHVAPKRTRKGHKKDHKKLYCPGQLQFKQKRTDILPCV